MSYNVLKRYLQMINNKLEYKMDNEIRTWNENIPL